ncbi:MAG: holo-ACP synthase [Opitutales bacterium]|nr:holo-ACP synthase [Opitutales bacterium]
MLENLEISVGTDIVDALRIKRAISRFGQSFIGKIFTKNEIQYCLNFANSYQSFAARFAAKEAFAKAIGIGLGSTLRWCDISVKNTSTGRPELILSSNAKALMEKSRFHTAKISLSHTKTLAQAVVILIS